MLHKFRHPCISVGIALVFMLSAGCQTGDSPVSAKDSPPQGESVPALESRVLLDPVATTPALRGALIQPHVVSARAMLENQGYAYVEANSMVLIQESIEIAPSGFDGASRGPRPPRNPARVDRVRTDTVSWLAFENPTHDLGNHTAVLHFSNGSTSGTVLMELDISGEWPQVIRQGYMSDTGFVSADVGVETWLGCALSGAAGTAMRCAFTNCGFGHCAAIGGAAVLVGCTIGSIVSRLGW